MCLELANAGNIAGKYFVFPSLRQSLRRAQQAGIRIHGRDLSANSPENRNLAIARRFETVELRHSVALGRIPPHAFLATFEFASNPAAITRSRPIHNCPCPAREQRPRSLQLLDTEAARDQDPLRSRARRSAGMRDRSETMVAPMRSAAAQRIAQNNAAPTHR